MTLTEAAAHVGNPVLARDGGRTKTGEVVEVDEGRRRVRVRLRRQTHPYDLTGHGWFAPCHLTIPQWWTDRSPT